MPTSSAPGRWPSPSPAFSSSGSSQDRSSAAPSMRPTRSCDDMSSPDREAVSELTTGRLSVYLRCLNFLAAQHVETVSSSQLAHNFHLNSAQIRKDLACFGEFGTRGVGY